MSAPNNFGSNLIKAITILPISRTGAPVDESSPSQVELIVSGAPVSPSNPLPISVPAGSLNSAETAANASGPTTLLRTSPNTTIVLTVTGLARTSPIVMGVTGAVDGDRVTVLADLPATANINLDFRDATAGGTQLLPAINYASQVLTTPGTAYRARIDLFFDGSAWGYAGSANPA